MKCFRVLSVFVVILFLAPQVFSCTTFTLEKDGKIVYGRNLDWTVGSGLVIANQRNIHKKAFLMPRSQRPENPAEWTSKYGSITFNSLAREFPTGGMNEAGLVVDIMWLDTSQYPKADARPEVNTLQWTQYLLDTCQTVEEVLAAESKIRISEDGFPPQHFLICDKTGKTAVIEFLDGKQINDVGNSLPIHALTNHTYPESIAYTAQFKGFGGEKEIPQSRGSLDRFVRAADSVQNFASAKDSIVDYAFQILHRVNAGYSLQGHATVWSIVYDLSDRKIHFRTNGNREICILDMNALDFSNQNPVRVWEVQNDQSGDITAQSFEYDREMNREIILKQLSDPGVIRQVGDLRVLFGPLAAYPETFTSNKP